MSGGHRSDSQVVRRQVIPHWRGTCQHQDRPETALLPDTQRPFLQLGVIRTSGEQGLRQPRDSPPLNGFGG